jgi:hypothetical protein
MNIPTPAPTCKSCTNGSALASPTDGSTATHAYSQVTGAPDSSQTQPSQSIPGGPRSRRKHMASLDMIIQFTATNLVPMMGVPRSTQKPTARHTNSPDVHQGKNQDVLQSLIS